MARHSAAFRTAGAGSTTLPSGSIFSAAGSGFVLIEAHAFNTTTTGVAVALRRMTAQGTVGAGQTEIEHEEDLSPPLATVFDTHTVAPTFVTGELARASLAAAVGGGIVWTFPKGVKVDLGTGNGICIVTATGTGQILDVVFVWDE